MAGQGLHKELTESEKRAYIDGYLSYYQTKYLDKKTVDFPAFLEQTEEQLTYEQIDEMRSKALQKLSFVNLIKDLTKRIEREEGR